MHLIQRILLIIKLIRQKRMLYFCHQETPAERGQEIGEAKWAETNLERGQANTLTSTQAVLLVIRCNIVMSVRSKIANLIWLCSLLSNANRSCYKWSKVPIRIFVLLTKTEKMKYVRARKPPFSPLFDNGQNLIYFRVKFSKNNFLNDFVYLQCEIQIHRQIIQQYL